MWVLGVFPLIIQLRLWVEIEYMSLDTESRGIFVVDFVSSFGYFIWVSEWLYILVFNRITFDDLLYFWDGLSCYCGHRSHWEWNLEMRSHKDFSCTLLLLTSCEISWIRREREWKRNLFWCTTRTFFSRFCVSGKCWISISSESALFSGLAYELHTTSFVVSAWHGSPLYLCVSYILGLPLVVDCVVAKIAYW